MFDLLILKSQPKDLTEDLVDYFQGHDKLYLASADQYLGLANVLESNAFLQCRHFYSVTGGMGGLNVLARQIEAPSTIHWFDCNEDAQTFARFITTLIQQCPARNEFIEDLYFRPFDAFTYCSANQQDYYALPIENKFLDRLQQKVGDSLAQWHQENFMPYIVNPSEDIYSGPSVHATKIPVFHEAMLQAPMTHPFKSRDELKRKKISNINSWFFGKGWLASEDTFARVRNHLSQARVSYEIKSIFEFNPPENSGLYASNVFAPDKQKEFIDVIQRFVWTVMYTIESNYLLSDFRIRWGERIIPIKSLWGQGDPDVHMTCCQMIDNVLKIKEAPFLEVVFPHPTEKMDVGFKHYPGQKPILFSDFLKRKFPHPLPDDILIHILLGNGCRFEDWAACVDLACEIGRRVVVFEHRRACSDWPEWDVDPDLVPDERSLDIFLLTKSARWEKHAMANNRGQIEDPRNLAWVLSNAERTVND